MPNSEAAGHEWSIFHKHLEPVTFTGKVGLIKGLFYTILRKITFRDGLETSGLMVDNFFTGMSIFLCPRYF